MTATPAVPTQENRKIALICSKGGLDECCPALIMANAARMSGIEAAIFFTFYGLDVVTESKVDHLHVNMVGNPTSPIPPFVAGLPGMEHVASSMMRKEMNKLDLPSPREMIQMLSASGCRLYGCELAMKMFGRSDDELLPEVERVITATEFYEVTIGYDIVFI